MNTFEYEILSRRTRNGALSKEKAKLNAALGLGESGEVQNLVKKEVFHGHPKNRAGIIDEVGDILYYCAWLGDLYGFSLIEAMNANIEKLRARYPEGFSSERSINR